MWHLREDITKKSIFDMVSKKLKLNHYCSRLPVMPLILLEKVVDTHIECSHVLEY